MVQDQPDRYKEVKLSIILLYVSYISAQEESYFYHLLEANTPNMIIAKLMALVAFVEVAVGEPPVPSPPPPTPSTEDILQRPQVVHKAFIVTQEAKETYQFRYGYEIHDPDTAITTSQYEIRYNDVNVGIYNRFVTKGGLRSTVNFTFDAANGYRATLSDDSQGHVTLDYAHFTSPLASSTPPSTEEKEAYTNFLVDDKENIDKHSPEAESAYKTHKIVKNFFNFVPTQQYSLGYEFDGIRSQYETYRGTNGEGRIAMVNADGCVSSMDYTLDENNFNVSTVRHFGQQDISQLYLNPEQYPLLLQIASGSSKCSV